MNDTKTLEKKIYEIYGMPLEAFKNNTPDGELITIRPVDIEYTIGFSIEILKKWRSLELSFTPGKYAAELVSKMGRASNEKKAIFASFVNSIINNDAKFTIKINDNEYDPSKPEGWPSEWNQLYIKMRKEAINFDNNALKNEQLILSWSLKFLGAIISLLPVENVSDDEYQYDNEGEQHSATINLYERSKLNRAICIELHGSRCKVCGFSFADQYGEIGEGYIHVHHVEPLSTMSKVRVIDPSIELIPVCPNCHSMLHKKTPPYTVEEMKYIIKLNNIGKNN